MTDRIAEIEERWAAISPMSPVSQDERDIRFLLKEMKAKDAECERLREMLRECEPALFALIVLYPDKESEPCKEIRAIRDRVLAELEGK